MCVCVPRVCLLDPQELELWTVANSKLEIEPRSSLQEQQVL